MHKHQHSTMVKSPQKTSMGEMNHHASHGSSSGLALLLSLILFVLISYFVKPKKNNWQSKKWDIFKIKGIESLIKHRYFSFAIRLLPALLFLFVIVSGLYGRPRTSFAAPFTWLFWWTLLIFFVAFAGKIFCAVCPWDFFANLFQFVGIHGNSKKPSGLNIKWPKALKNTYIAIAFFIIFTWLELGAGLTQNSYTTAILGLVVVGLAILSAFIFEKRSFCRYACPVGRISGLYAQFSPMELRVKDHDVCKSCKSKDCVKGGVYSTPCPTGEIPFKLKQNTYCTLCTECIRSCEKNNLTLKLRSLGTDLYSPNLAKKDEVLFILVILTLTFFHGLTMIPTWSNWIGQAQDTFRLNYTTAFTLLMGTIILIVLGVFGVLRRFNVKFLVNENHFKNLIFAFVPLALGYHLGHNLMHILSEGTYLIPFINDPFGHGSNFFGWKGFEPTSLVSHSRLIWIQLLFLLAGFYYSIKTLKTRELRSSNESEAFSLSRLSVIYSHFVVLIALGLLGVWFVFQPMMMRTHY